MDSPIVITPQEIVNLILAICGAIITISGAGTIIIRAIAKVKEPNVKQDERLDKLEIEISDLKGRLKDDAHNLFLEEKRVEEIEQSQKETNRIIIKSLQALTKHALDGNDIEALKEAERSLDGYLIEKAS